MITVFSLFHWVKKPDWIYFELNLFLAVSSVGEHKDGDSPVAATTNATTVLLPPGYAQETTTAESAATTSTDSPGRIVADTTDSAKPSLSDDWLIITISMLGVLSLLIIVAMIAAYMCKPKKKNATAAKPG